MTKIIICLNIWFMQQILLDSLKVSKLMSKYCIEDLMDYLLYYSLSSPLHNFWRGEELRL